MHCLTASTKAVLYRFSGNITQYFGLDGIVFI